MQETHPISVGSAQPRWPENAGPASVALRPLALWPRLSSPVAEINHILMSEPLDLKQLTEVVDMRPEFGNRIVKLANSSLFGLAQPVSTVAQAGMMIASELLRILALTCHLVEHVGRNLPETAGILFWRHALLVAALSQRAGHRAGFAEPELAYFAGLLHDIGWLPLLAEEAARNQQNEPGESFCSASLEARRTGRGLDHCVLGTAIGGLWHFPPALVEIFGFHHEPDRAPSYPDLAGIVATAEACAHLADSQPQHLRGDSAHSGSRLCAPNTAQSQNLPGNSGREVSITMVGGPEDPSEHLDDQLRQDLINVLETESRRIDQWLRHHSEHL